MAPLAVVKSLPGSQKITDNRGSGLRMAHGIRGAVARVLRMSGYRAD